MTSPLSIVFTSLRPKRRRSTPGVALGVFLREAAGADDVQLVDLGPPLVDFIIEEDFDGVAG
jgi:hypothetical protein